MAKQIDIVTIIAEHIEFGCQLFMDGVNSKNRKGSDFEASIISVLFLVKYAEKNTGYNEFKLIERYAKGYLALKAKYIEHAININSNDFINLRFKQYQDELLSHSSSVPSKTAFNLYDTPLQPNGGQNWDIDASFNIGNSLSSYLDVTEDVINLINCSITNPVNEIKPTSPINVKEDKLSTVLHIVSFLLPLIGIIIYFSNKDKMPNKANSAGRSALWGAGLNLIITLGGK